MSTVPTATAPSSAQTAEQKAFPIATQSVVETVIQDLTVKTGAREFLIIPKPSRNPQTETPSRQEVTFKK